MYQSQLKIFLPAFIILIALLFYNTGCDSILPDEFESKEFDSPEKDDLACSMISPEITDTVDGSGRPDKIFTYYNFERILSHSLPSLVDTATQRLLLQDSITQNQVINQQYDLVSAQLQNLPYDKLIFLQYDGKISYAKLQADQPRDIFIYIGLFNTGVNINQYVNVEVMKRDTSILGLSVNMETESVTSCTDTVYVEQALRIIPSIRGRYRVHLEQGEYLVRFNLSDPGLLRGSDKGPVNPEFKIVILSI